MGPTDKGEHVRLWDSIYMKVVGKSRMDNNNIVFLSSAEFIYNTIMLSLIQIE